MVNADRNTYTGINQPQQVAYLSCDNPNGDTFITPDMMLATLMENKPKAIVLYTTVGNWCSIQGSGFEYKSIFTMADGGDAAQVMNYLNGTNDLDVVPILITGNLTGDGSDVAANNQGTNNSAVAMSILYSITGLITLLFLIIIGTGAIRAHRYPERYGPRSSYGGRPRQSRAKGIARAVLETIPIIKFGSQLPPKPDPALELESQPPLDLHRLSVAPRDATPEPRPTERRKTIAPKPASYAAKDSTPKSADSTEEGDEHLGCSICTDDFAVGEDVRVLPCNHKFHPACIDPWLVNVSGTCPLW